ncbi:MAG: hypothetical protein Kow0037_13600 [Calditrichia bacterium]
MAQMLQKSKPLPLPQALKFVLLYVVLARLGMQVASLPPGNLSIIWLPSGLGLVGFILMGSKLFPFVWLSSFLANFPSLLQLESARFFGQSLLASLGVSGVDALQSYLAYQIYLHLFKEIPESEGLWTVIRLSLQAIIPGSVCAPLIILILAAGDLIPAEDLDSLIFHIVNLSFADSMGIFLILPLFWAYRLGRWKNWQRRQCLEFFSWLAVLVVAIYLGFHWENLPAFLSFPILLALAVRLGLAGVSVGLLVASIWSIVLTSWQVGPFASLSQEKAYLQLLGFLLLAALPLLAVAITTQALKDSRDHLEEMVEHRTRELREALQKIKTLHGILPICSHCKRVRTDEGAWQQLEAYVRDHSEADFSHGICPDCVIKYYPQLIKHRKEDDVEE